MKPEVLVMDEPAAQLDPLGKTQVFNVLKELLYDGATIVVAEHEIEELATFTDRMILLEGGGLSAKVSQGMYSGRWSC